MQLQETCIKMTGDGTSMTQSKEVIGQEIKMQLVI